MDVEISPSVFISYCWESDEHKSWVAELATRLKNDGLIVTLDQWHLHLGDQLPSFMERAVGENDFVLIVCTPKYKAKSEQRSGGVGYEGDVIQAEVFIKNNHRKFIPILRSGDWVTSAPSQLLGKVYVDLRDGVSSHDHYADLLRALRGESLQPPTTGLHGRGPSRQQPDAASITAAPSQETSAPPRSGAAAVGPVRPTPLAVLNHYDSVRQVKFHPLSFSRYFALSTSFVTASDDHMVRRFSRQGTSTACTSTLPHDGKVHHVAFSHSGKYLVSASSDHTARVWSYDELLGAYQHRDSVFYAVFSPNDKYILTAGAEQTARLWWTGCDSLSSSDSGFHSSVFKMRPTAMKHRWGAAGIRRAAFSFARTGGGPYLATAGGDGRVQVWGEYGKSHLSTFRHKGGINAIEFSRDGKLLLTASGDRTACLWIAQNGHLLSTFMHDAAVRHAVFSPDGRYVLTASEDRAARLWNTENGTLVKMLEHGAAVNYAAFSPPGPHSSLLLITASDEGTAMVWDARSGRCLAILGHDKAVNHADFSPDGRFILTASDDRTARLWDASHLGTAAT